MVESTFVVCKGQMSALDLAHYDTTPGICHTGFLTFSWGFISDVDLESEVIRCLGALRNDVWGVWRVLNLRTYKAKFSYLPPSSTPVDVLPPLSEPLPSDWVTIDDDFIVFWACQVSHAGYNLHNSPLSELQDGLFRVMVVR
jgi:sphingosine kinase